jgi:acetyltransferase-like isoleucine patch superfamily enzyme
MTIKSKIFNLFPTLHIVLILSAIYCFVKGPNPLSFGAIFFFIYFFPLICFRLLVFLYPIKEDVTDIFSSDFSSWWAGHQIQLLFMAVPRLESVMIMVPGLYSIWLRGWGSQIGKGVYWTPGVTNYDRNLLEIGDGVIFGERATTVCHVISPKGGKGLLKVSKIKIADHCFVGAGSVLSPGVTMEEKTFVKAGAHVYPGTRIFQGGHEGKIVTDD